ncbi:MAG: hypothetical protein O3B13_01220 [Planctomycetota bacterium]|nr:hypothetical protein [Planctomycetota bacterium]
MSAIVGASDARLAELVAWWPELSEAVRGEMYQLAVSSTASHRR